MFKQGRLQKLTANHRACTQRGTNQEAGSNLVAGHEGFELMIPPTNWDHLENFVNVEEDLLTICTRRITQQHTYDKKPLGFAVCCGCGHLLWSCVDGTHTFLVDKPSGMSDTCWRLRAIPSCTAGFMYTERGTSTRE